MSGPARKAIPPGAVKRHATAGVASIVMVTGWVGVLGYNGWLGRLVPADRSVEYGLIAAVIVTAGVFFPFAAMSEWAWRGRRAGGWAPPVILAGIAAGVGLIVEAMAGRFHVSFVPFYGVAGMMVGAMFCGYWVPLKMSGHGARS